MSDAKIIIGISQGDINGIGPEVILKTLMEPGISEICTPVLFSSQKTISYYRKMLGMEEFSFNPMRDFTQLNTKRVNVFICYEEEVNMEVGKATETGGKYARISLEQATQALINNQVDVLVTGPICKDTIRGEGFDFPGHTEYLAHKLGGEAMMILCSESGLRVALVTGHLPLAEVAAKLSVELVSKKITQLCQSLLMDFGIRKPKIAVLGLNPHAGENASIGLEDRDIIRPAIDQVKLDALVYGPYSADGLFGSGAYRKFDAVLAMYHDQGLIPFKTLAFNEGVNFTAGLEKIRTSPDHGTAFDLAGKNQASEESFRKALYAAIDIHRNRKMHQNISANPLAHANLRKER